MTSDSTARRRHGIGPTTAPATRWTLHVAAIAGLLVVASCASGTTSDSSAVHVDKRVIARSVSGAPGVAPTMLSGSQPTKRAGDAQEQAALTDRTVRVDSASARPLARGGFVAVDVAVTIRATGPG